MIYGIRTVRHRYRIVYRHNVTLFRTRIFRSAACVMPLSYHELNSRTDLTIDDPDLVLLSNLLPKWHAM